MVLDYRGTYLGDFRRQLGDGLYQVQKTISAPVNWLRWTQRQLVSREQLISANNALLQNQLRAGEQLQQTAALSRENARLRGLLKARDRVQHPVAMGEILSLDMDPLRRRVVLNQGLKEGAFAGQTLIDAHGVVGQITRTYQHNSEALLITDQHHAVPVAILRNGLLTIAMGTGDPERLSLPFLTRNANIKPGDLLVTSGLGGAFPAGYPVGLVITVDGSGGDAFLEVTATPAARLSQLQEVLLIFPENPSPPIKGSSTP